MINDSAIRVSEGNRVAVICNLEPGTPIGSTVDLIVDNDIISSTTEPIVSGSKDYLIYFSAIRANN